MSLIPLLQILEWFFYYFSDKGHLLFLYFEALNNLLLKVPFSISPAHASSAIP